MSEKDRIADHWALIGLVILIAVLALVGIGFWVEVEAAKIILGSAQLLTAAVALVGVLAALERIRRADEHLEEMLGVEDENRRREEARQILAKLEEVYQTKDFEETPLVMFRVGAFIETDVFKFLQAFGNTEEYEPFSGAIRQIIRATQKKLSVYLSGGDYSKVKEELYQEIFENIREYLPDESMKGYVNQFRGTEPVRVMGFEILVQVIDPDSKTDILLAIQRAIKNGDVSKERHLWLSDGEVKRLLGP